MFGGFTDLKQLHQEAIALIIMRCSALGGFTDLKQLHQEAIAD